jgi:hypothetical protein
MALALFSKVGLQTGKCATVLRCSTRMFAAQLHPNDSVSNPGDAFAAQLQAKTERELLELLERRNSQPEKTTEQHSGQQSAAKPQPGQQQVRLFLGMCGN